jgi:hypothetical protein
MKPHEMRRIVVLKIRGGQNKDQIGKPDISPGLVRPSLAGLLRSQIEKRSSFRDPMRRRVIDLLQQSPEQIMDKIAANDEAARMMDYGMPQPSFLEKAAPIAALAAALFALYRKNVKGVKLPQFVESAFAKSPEIPAAIVGAGVGGAFGLAGQSLIQHFEGTPQEKVAKSFAREAGLAGMAFAAPYLYSGYVQAKAMRGEPISKTEAAIARRPGSLGIAGALGTAYRGSIAKKAKGLWKKYTAPKKPESWYRGILEKVSSAKVPVENILRHGSDPDVVDMAISDGLCKVAQRVDHWVGKQN